jgi:hypothetical protein
MLVVSVIPKWPWQKLYLGPVNISLTESGFYLILFIFQGYLDKTNVPNISSVRSVKYGQKTMKVFKASGIGIGLSYPYKTIQIENNMRVTSPFTVPINDQSSGATPKRYKEFYYKCCFIFFIKIGGLIESIMTYVYVQ